MIRASSTLFWFSMAIIASLAFYRTNDNVQALELKLRSLNAAIENEQRTIHVLKAEWVYLANPTRVEAEAHKHLALRPTAPRQVAPLNDLAEILPTHDESAVALAVNSTPIATIKTSLAPPRRLAKVKSHGAMAVASVDTGHINEHMILQHNSVPASADPIGSLITELGSHP
ncbi:MAG: hypothetical protein M3N08_09325 [Pseudomonadota bacterium]|nr:hypothetical protein [Pseudomonadota bacterium]